MPPSRHHTRQLVFRFVTSSSFILHSSIHYTIIVIYSFYHIVSSWNQANAAVVIAASQRVLLDVSPPQLGSINISGLLVVNNASIHNNKSLSSCTFIFSLILFIHQPECELGGCPVRRESDYWKYRLSNHKQSNIYFLWLTCGLHCT